jgi:ubiquitin carboxyl-terminal hydrolase 10
MIASIDHHHCPPLVLYHHALSCGHYTRDVLHPEFFLGARLSMTRREGWMGIDEEIVSEVRPEDVFGAVRRDDRCAYLLFFAQVAW